LRFRINFDKEGVGLHFGRIFYKLIWSPWPPNKTESTKLKHFLRASSSATRMSDRQLPPRDETFQCSGAINHASQEIVIAKQLMARVTRLGEVSPIGRLFTLGS
jgi:hypothetical protein